MISNYRGVLVLGFNSWMLVLPAMLIMAAIIGWKRYDLKHLSIRCNFTDGIKDLISITMGVIAGLMVMLESFWGIVQFSDNHLADGDSAVWSLLAPFGYGFTVALVMGIIIMFTISVASRVKYKWLSSEIEEIKAERRKKSRHNHNKRR